MKRGLWTALVCFALGTLLGIHVVAAEVQPEPTPAGQFVLAAEAGGQLVIAPQYVSYTQGQTLGEALMACGFEFTGLESNVVTAIEGITGNFTRSDQNGGYDLFVDASEVTHFCFSERSSSQSRPSNGVLELMTAMADYLQKDEDVRKVGMEIYNEAKKNFVNIESNDANTYAFQLVQAITNYENILSGPRYTVSFSDGTGLYDPGTYPGVTISLENAYGRSWSNHKDGKLAVPQGEYTFHIFCDGLGVSGRVTVASNTTVTAQLPDKTWLTTFRISGSYGEEHEFAAGEFSVENWTTRNGTVLVPDTFVGAVYTYAKYDSSQFPGQKPKMTALYTMQNAAQSFKPKDIPFNSFSSEANSVLAKGSVGNTIVYRVSTVGLDKYTYTQDYTVTFLRTPTLTGIQVTDCTDPSKESVDQAATTGFSGDVIHYTYNVLDTVKTVKVTAQGFLAGYAITVNGQDASQGVAVTISEETTVSVVVTAEGRSNTYTLTICPGAGRKLTFQCANDVSIHVVNRNGVVMPYTKYKEGNGTVQTRYQYTLVPGEVYNYIATRNEYYHVTDDFTLEQTTNSTITVNFPDDEVWLKGLAFGAPQGYKNFRDTLPLNTPFTSGNHRYQVAVPDTESNIYLWVEADKKAEVEVLYDQVYSHAVYHGKPYRDVVYSGSTIGYELVNLLMHQNPVENELTLRLSKENNGITYYQEYQVEFKRELTLKNITATCDEALTVLQHSGGSGYSSSVKDYFLKVSMAAMAVELDIDHYTDIKCYGEEDPGYRVKVNGTDVTETGMVRIQLDGSIQTQYVTITVENPKAKEGTGTYTIQIRKSPPVDVTFQLEPGNALLNIRQQLSQERLWPGEVGTYQLCEGYSYPYVLTQYGYVSRSGVLTVTREGGTLVVDDNGTHIPVTEGENGGAVTLTWELDAAKTNPNINPGITAQWPNFRGNSNNNAVTKAPIPTDAENGKNNWGTLYWANKLGNGIDSDAVGSPILVDGYLITYASNKLYRVDTFTGEVVDSATMADKSSFSITPPTYWGGMVFVALSNGRVQAFNAETLESLWIYTDPMKGQPNCPLTVSGGYLYTGFWNSESGKANFVCISVTDEDPHSSDEKKEASWFYTNKGGYYWAGAYACNDFVLVGTDDGDNTYVSQTSRLLLLDAKTGRLMDSLNNLNGDIRSTVVKGDDGLFYFTSKGGTFYGVNVINGKLRLDKKVHLTNGLGGVPMSTSSPVVYNGRAYIGVSGSGQFSAYSGHNITVIDIASNSIAYRVNTQGYPQTSGLVTTAYDGYAYVYFFDNYTPGKLRVIRDRPGQTGPDRVTEENGGDTAYTLFTPTGDHAEYAICSPIVDEYGTVYFKNDSAHLMAFGSAIVSLEVNTDQIRTRYLEGETFDPTGMVVTAVYANGKERDITDYVKYNKEPLSLDDNSLTISFCYGESIYAENPEEFVPMYHNRENGSEMSIVSTSDPSVTIGLTVSRSVWGDVDGNGTLDGEDAQRILDYEAQVINKAPALAVADVNGDGKINSDDAHLLLEKLLNSSNSGDSPETSQ